MREFKGKVERVKDSVIVGWAQCDEGDDPHVQFRLRINNVESGPYVANLFRDDLRKKLIGNGHHGFKVFVPDNSFRQGDNVIEIFSQPDNVQIGPALVYRHGDGGIDEVRPISVRPAPTGARSIRGKLERVRDDIIYGWAFNENNPSESLKFALMINGEEVGIHRADLMRGDLADAGIGDGDHGFMIDLPDEKLKAGDNVIEVRLLPEGTIIDEPLIHPYTPPPPRVRPAPVAEAAPVRPAAPKPVATPVPVSVAPVSMAPAAGTPGEPAVPRYAEIRPRNKIMTIKPPLTRDGVGGVLASMLARTNWKEKDVYGLVEEQAKTQNWQLLTLICEGFPEDFQPSARILTWQARAALYLSDLDTAARLFEQVYDLDPRKHGSIFYLGVTYARQSRWTDAVRIFEECVALEPEKEAKYYLELGRALIRIGFGAYGVFQEDRSVLPRAIAHIEKAVAIDPENIGAMRELAMLFLHMLRYDEALAMAEAAVAKLPNDLSSLIDLTRIHVRLNNIDAAMEVSQRALSVAPANDTCKFNHRVISRLIETARPRGENTLGVIVEQRTGNLSGAEVTELSGTRSWGSAILTSKARWILLGADPSRTAAQSMSLVSAIGYDWAAGVRDHGEQKKIIWRRDYLASLFQAGILGTHSSLAQIEHAASLHARISDSDVSGPPDIRPTPASGTVILFSQYGIRKFGGGEHFLQQMGQIYRSMGYDVLVIGTTAELVGEEGEVDGLRYRFIDKSPQEFVRLVFEEKPVVAHMISGLAFEVTMAFRFFNVALIHGIHFWRDMLAPPTPSTGYYPDVDLDNGEGRPEFNGVLRDSEVVYANSHYTRKMVEELYGARSPIVFSLPDNVEPGEVGEVLPDGRDFVLLANARADKGYDIFVQAAKRLPHIRFCAIASQSSRDIALAELAREGVSNVELLDHVADMTTLYRKARVVAVPSYRFVETFSRVVIEAQRFGVPVLGSDKGNVPYLLVESGGSLPEDADAWAAEISRLFDDDGYWSRQSRRALENSERYSFNMQAKRLGHLVAAVDKPLLVGVGSGLGNVIHTAPMIRNIARRTGRPVDVVMAGDHKDMLFVLGKRDYVNHAFVLNDDVINRRYEAVFITHSFGTAIPHFATNRLLQSRAWKVFHPGHELHETEFNLAAAKGVLGVDYDEDDIHQYFLGDYVYQPPKDVLVGIHAGSKGGIWGAKRWPGYGAMAQRLIARGIRVASFGTPDEYVEGTENRTGGTIEEMTRAMLPCSHFVANDSGVMNVANALGIPLVALFAPTNVKTRGPLGVNSQSIVIARDCSPCELDNSKESKFTNATCDCIGAIKVDDVLKALGL